MLTAVAFAILMEGKPEFFLPVPLCNAITPYRVEKRAILFFPNFSLSNLSLPGPVTVITLGLTFLFYPSSMFEHQMPRLSPASLAFAEVLIAEVAIRNRERIKPVLPLLLEHYRFELLYLSGNVNPLAAATAPARSKCCLPLWYFACALSHQAQNLLQRYPPPLHFRRKYLTRHIQRNR